MPPRIQDLPSIVVSDILGFLEWTEKLNVIQAIPQWRSFLCATAAWPSLTYSGEQSENVYFVNEKRANLLIILKLYGIFMKNIKLSFSHPLGRSGLQILNAIADNCKYLQHFTIIPHHTKQHILGEVVWKKSGVTSLCNILENCKSLNDVAVLSPIIQWSDSPEANIVEAICQKNVAHKLTHLELEFNSLIEHEGYLRQLLMFKNLRKLSVKRDKINNEILMELVKGNLQEITLYQDEELPLAMTQQLNDRFWIDILKVNPNFKIDLILRFIVVIKDSFPAHMPLRALVLDDLVNIVTKGVMDHLVQLYKNTLESFTYTNSFLENFETGDSRLPAALVSMVTKCQKLSSLKYGFPLSSTSVLLIVHARKLKKLVLPAVEISYEFDWPEDKNWDSDFIQMLKEGSRSEMSLEKSVSAVLGFNWKLEYESLGYMQELEYGYSL